MVYARRQTRPKPLKSETKKWQAPVAGWVSNRALSDSRSIEGPGAAVLDNFFPRATGVALRRGKERYATLLEEDRPVTSLFSYRGGNVERLFGSNDSTIYDLTNVTFAEAALLADEDGDEFVTETGDTLGWGSTDGLEVATGYTGGDWSVVQFATTGGIYLIGVNGQDEGFIFDGQDFWPNTKGGLWYLPLATIATPFEVGETVTGGTSGATATVYRVDTNRLVLRGVEGDFEAGETITGGVGGNAEVASVPTKAVPGMDFGAFTSAAMSFVWTYKNRLWFAQKDSLTAWYLDVDSIGGEAQPFPMGGIFANGGELLFGARWSLESGGEGGLSDQNVFVTSAGEAAIYQGSSPSEAATWALVGVYRVGTPLGKRAYIRGGGDLAIATTVGLVPLSKAISLDVTALNVATISYKIADAWTDAIRLRGPAGWQAMIWPEGKMAAVAPPDLIGASDPVIFVSNTETGAWSRYTNWQANCLEVFRGQLYFGSVNGRVFLANVGGMDDGETYTGSVVPLFDDMNAPASMKVSTVVRAATKSAAPITDRVDVLSDFETELPPAPDATAFNVGNTWGTATWGSSTWGADNPNYVADKWSSAGAMGYRLAPCYRVTSGSVSALDVELIEMTTLHTTATAVS